MMRPTFLLLLRVFVAAGTCLPSRCLAPEKGIHLTEPLPCNARRDTHIDRLMGGVFRNSLFNRILWSSNQGGKFGMHGENDK
jgi:hypothetical protein